MPPADADGPLLFARFAYPPNALGYCGPSTHSTLLEYADASASDGGLRELATRFSGAWPYLELIATATGIGDPLDHRVVEAYWIGNDLLDQIDLSGLGHSLKDRFEARAGAGWTSLAETIPAGATPNHAFHVFSVYPWVGMLCSRTALPSIHFGCWTDAASAGGESWPKATVPHPSKPAP